MEMKTTLFCPNLPPMTVEQLYQSQEHTCSGNDAELIAFNPDAADNTRVCSLTQRAQSMRREREGQYTDKEKTGHTERGKQDNNEKKRVGRKIRSLSKMFTEAALLFNQIWSILNFN